MLAEIKHKLQPFLLWLVKHYELVLLAEDPDYRSSFYLIHIVVYIVALSVLTMIMKVVMIVAVCGTYLMLITNKREQQMV